MVPAAWATWLTRNLPSPQLAHAADARLREVGKIDGEHVHFQIPKFSTSGG
jgi:hypothetical protein